MSELTTVVYRRRPLFDASAENLLVFTVLRFLGCPTQLLGEINILYPEQSQVGVSVQRFGANNLLSGKQTFFQRKADTGIQRPTFLEKLLLYKRKEVRFFQKSIVTATGLSVWFIGRLPFHRLVAENRTGVQGHCTTPDFVTNCVGRTTNSPGDAIG